MFGLGKRELEAKFRRSEMVLLAWRSQEVSAEMEKQTKGVRETLEAQTNTSQRRYHGASVPEGLPSHFFRKDYDPEAGIGPGELDLRQVSGEEAFKYFSSIGVKLPIIGRR